ncbi:MAG: NAD(P)H-quinone oxidoreductase [Beijerinckiaceae bacterium]|jgi:NADPH:quinone reductase|nr:NAD(P)H-quinone oxidoreductase [Beijerinckiaceae bacterium]
MTAIPATMTAIAITQPGPPDVLQPEERPVPKPGPGQILIKVEAAGVNRPDVAQRLGRYPAPPGASDLPGLEVAGTVAAVGEGVSRWKLGDKVCALCHGGGYAEYVVVSAGHTLPVPDGFTMIEAAGIPETFFTVWVNGFMTAGLKKDEWLLIHGGSSGIGTTAIMLAKAMGAKVITTAGTDEKCDFCRTLGADVAVNYKTQDFVEEVKKATDGKGVNVILDMVAGPYVQKNFECCARDARIGQIAVMSGSKMELDIRAISMKRIVWTGSALRPRTDDEKTAIAQSLEKSVMPFWKAGQCKPVIDSTFPLREAHKAHARMETSEHIGKIILTM